MNRKDVEMVGETLGESVRALRDTCNKYVRGTMQKAARYYHVGAECVYYFVYSIFPWVTPAHLKKPFFAEEPKAPEGEPKAPEGEPKAPEGEPKEPAESSQESSQEPSQDHHMKTE